jgi:hypothetical protein
MDDKIVPGAVAGVEYVSVCDGLEAVEAAPVETPLRVVLEANGYFSCSFCHHTFKNKQSCTRHFAIHLGKTRCNICQKLFSRVENLRLHQTSVHRDIFCLQQQPQNDNSILPN